MNLPILQRDPSCTACDLHAGVKSVCIGSDLRHPCDKGPTDQCVLVLGEKPGTHEDEQCLNFVGASGRKLSDFYVYAPYLNQCADIYVANAVRCRVPQDGKATMSHIRACSGYTLDDINRLSSAYRRVAVLCVGSAGLSLFEDRAVAVSDYSGRQTKRLEPWPNVYLFSTYHPAYLLRDPSHEGKVKSVVLALNEWLVTGTIAQEEPPEYVVSPKCPSELHGPLALDTETNGCLVDGVQSYFHPRKMVYHNGLSKDDILVTAQIAWRDPDGSMRSGVFRWDHARERREFTRWLSLARRSGREIWGQHLQFDAKVLRWCAGKSVLPAWHPLRDLLVETFLYDDSQERGLKATAWLYRITDYSEDPKPVHEYKDSSDERLLFYGAKDAWATYRGLEVVRQWMADRYSAHPIACAKLDDRRYQWYSDQLWSAILMEECGARFDLGKLRTVHDDVKVRWDSVVSECAALGVIARGTGSDGSVDNLISRAIDEARRLLPDTEFESLMVNLERTKVTDRISTGADNRNQLLGAIPPADSDAQLVINQLSLINEAASLEKIATSYTAPMLFGKKPVVVKPLVYKWLGKPGRPRKDGKGLTKSTLRLVRKPSPAHAYTTYESPPELLHYKAGVGIAYPDIYILPKATDESGGAGGVRQPRWSFKRPPLQTLPDPIASCAVTGFDPGILWSLDLAQIEWRMTAFLSGDSVMLKEIADGTDIHSRTAYMLAGFPREELDSWLRSSEGKRTVCAAPDLSVRNASRQWASLGCPVNYMVDGTPFVSFIHSWLRQNIGKSQNFAENYGGMPSVIQRTCRVKGGLNVPMSRVQSWYNWTQSLYSGRTRWREGLVEGVVSELAVHLDLLGQSRTFGGTEDDIRGLQRPAILDVPVQGPSFNVMLGGMMYAQKEYMQLGMRTRFVMQVHDASPADSPFDEYATAVEIFKKHLTSNWYMLELEKMYNRKFPLGWEISVLDTQNCQPPDVKEQ